MRTETRKLDKPRSPSPQEPPHEPGVCLQLDLTFFKTRPCRITTVHPPKRCPYYHDPKKDRRRPPQGYVSDMCAYVANNKECPYGETCTNAHNRAEEFYHPDKYKTKFCTCYPSNLRSCEYGEFCCFAHSEGDLRIDLLHLMEHDADFYMFHYKMVWCPFNETNHAREQCVYAHNWQDFRRRPNVHQYKKEQCQNWSSSKIINVYYEGCVNGMKCQYSHGWKEQEFHPLNYKINPCRHGEGCSKPHCPYYHSDKDRRFPVANSVVLVPRNRVVGFPSQGYPNQHTPISVRQQPPANVMMVQPTQPPMFVGSPMEGLQYSPYFAGTHMSPYASPHLSPHVSPHMSPHVSPHDSPHMGPRVAPDAASVPSLTTDAAPFYPQARFVPPPASQPYYASNRGGMGPPPGLSASHSPLAPGSPRLPPSPKTTQMTTTAAPFIPGSGAKAKLAREAAAAKDAAGNKTGPKGKRESAGEQKDEDLLLQFLKENGLEHLASKFAKFGLTESNLMTLSETNLEQLDVKGEDKVRLLEALENTKTAGQRAMANLVDFD